MPHKDSHAAVWGVSAPVFFFMQNMLGDKQAAVLSSHTDSTTNIALEEKCSEAMAGKHGRLAIS